MLVVSRLGNGKNRKTVLPFGFTGTRDLAAATENGGDLLPPNRSTPPNMDTAPAGFLGLTGSTGLTSSTGSTGWVGPSSTSGFEITGGFTGFGSGIRRQMNCCVNSHLQRLSSFHYRA